MTLEACFHIERGAFTLDAQLNVPGRGITAIFGPSGCGKTTLLRAVAGLEWDPHGRLALGETVWQDSGHFVPPHRRPVGYVPQEAGLFPHLSVRGNLEYGFKRVPPGERRVAFDEAAAWLGVEPLLNRRPAVLSGGERRRAAVAQALLTSPHLLLMDEPLTALDAASKDEILPYLDRLHEELDIPVLYVSHAADEVARLADHLGLMEAGSVRASGPIGEMLTRMDLPLARGQDAESVVEAAVAGHDETFHLTYLDFPGGRFSVPRRDLPRGRRVRLRVQTRDVSLALARAADTSILNIFPARIESVMEEDPARVMVRLDVGGTLILSRLTRKSAHALRLEPGKQVYAQVKSVALLT